MGSPSFYPVYGTYTGNGGAADVEKALGFKPSRVEVKSVEGEAVWQEGMPGIWKSVDGGVPSFLDTGLAIVSNGFTVSGTDDTLNKDTVAYYYMAW